MTSKIINQFYFLFPLLISSQVSAQSFDQYVDTLVGPAADLVSNIIFFELTLGGNSFPLIVVWLIAAGVFFTVYLRFINITGFKHAYELLRGKHPDSGSSGELSYFQALATAVSGTVGIGNIGGVAIVISLGGPGAIFWLIVAGFVGMTTKFVESVAGVMFRNINPDGSVSGGPMYYLEKGIGSMGYAKFGKFLGTFYALGIVIGCLGIGNMFQSNQAFEQFLFISGGEKSFFADKGWLFGSLLAALVGLVILGGIQSIAKVTSKLVPFMTVFYVIGSLIVLGINFDKIPWAFSAILSQAFSPTSMAGGVIGVMILGFQRAAFSNEAGIGSAAIAHSTMKTDNPIKAGFIGLMEPFIDTVIICTMTGLVIITTIYSPDIASQGLQGIQLTSKAFSSTISWSAGPLSFIAILFAFSTMIAWSYYGLKGWTYLVGESFYAESFFKIIFCIFVAIGCMVNLGSILKLSDALIFVVAIPNLLGLYLLSPLIKKALETYKLER
jgi:AGCS family alanine or glycine:cation symporter